ncbi:MAG: recombinase family protein [Armatimonadetes bacterium]|nr:recombinase family protein [Armatimonadota bacterium]
MGEAKQVGIWIRVSTEDQARGESPEHHEKRAQDYAGFKEWQVREVYHLEGVSGKAVMSHPETQRMLSDIQSGRITGLIFSKLARLARNTRELLEFSELFNAHGADLISLHESIDTSTPAGRLFYTMIAAMAQWEREEIAERVLASVPIRAKLGKPLGGKAPFGYRWENKVLVPDPAEAPIRNLVYELFLEHRRKKRVARLLNEAGYRTRSGVEFSHSTVSKMLRDPTAKGLHRANYTRLVKGQCVLKPESEWVYTTVEAIVPEQLWTECNQILDDQEKRNKRPARKTVQLFSGVVLCSCGGKMYVPSKSHKYTCRKCLAKIDVDDLEEVFHEQLKAFFLSPDELDNYLAKADRVIQEKQDLLQTRFDEERKLKQEMDRVYRFYMDAEITPAGFGARYKPLEERLAQIEDQIPEVQAEIDFLKIQYLSSDEILHEARDLYARWPDLTYEHKRQIIESITQSIIIDKDEVIINLAYLPSSSELIAKSATNPRDGR